MKTTGCCIAVTFLFSVNAFVAADPPQDLRAELPRDVRIVLLGVPSVENIRTTEANLRQAIQGVQDELAKDSTSPTKIEAAKARLFFRLGQFDEAVAALAKSLHDQERIKGLEEYRDLARELQLHSESVANLSGTSEAPLVQEDDAPPAALAPDNPRELVKQLKAQLDQFDDVLRRIEVKARPDADRKAQLEKEVGTLGQFVFQIKNLTADLKAAEAGEREVRVDTGEIVRGVQGLIDVIREKKREREKSQPAQPESAEPRPQRRERIRVQIP